jgi:hypothetical protein
MRPGHHASHGTPVAETESKSNQLMNSIVYIIGAVVVVVVVLKLLGLY